MNGAADNPRSINELNSDLFAPEEDDRFVNPNEARKKAMDFLARREYGCEELQARLVKAGFDADIASQAVLQLADEGLQDDRRFVENFIQSRVNQGKGPVRIQADLGQKGLGSGLVDEVLQESDTDWFSIAHEERRKKFGPDVPGDFKEKARQMRFLQYRGFESAHIQAAISPHGED
ncbi:MAG: regulatory protein RecX [Gammaproteobacteria bacterium]